MECDRDIFPDMKVDILVRPYDRERDGDRPWHIVKAVFDEFGFPFDENDYDRDLREPHRYYAVPQGGFAVAELDGEAVGCVGWTDEGAGRFELHRLYVLAAARQFGLGEALVRWVLSEARRRGASEVVLFSDVHFTDAAIE